MWRPWAKQNNFRQHNGQLGTRVILKIGLASPRNPKFGERNITMMDVAQDAPEGSSSTEGFKEYAKTM